MYMLSQQPLVSVCLKEFERLAVKLNQSLADNRLVLAKSSLHVHHLCDRHTARNPLGKPVLKGLKPLKDIRYIRTG